jgi:hypothetical protein
LVLTFTVDAVVGNTLKIASSVFAAIKRYRADVQFEKDAKEALTIGAVQLRTTGYRRRSVHPLYANTSNFHPDNLAAMAALLHEDIHRAQRHNGIQEAASVEASLDHSMLLIGSPASEGLSRVVFGYEEAREDVLTCKGLGLELPYRWHFGEDLAISNRFYPPQEEPISRPNFAIAGPGGKVIYYPDLDGNNFQLTDYLLLTKLPNFLADQRRGSGHFIVSVGGAHGIATRAVERLLSNRSMIKRVVEDLAIDVDRAKTWPTAYQVLFKVGDIRHDVRHGSRAKSIVLVDSQRIDESPEWWQAWSTQTREAVVSWTRDDRQGA